MKKTTIGIVRSTAENYNTAIAEINQRRMAGKAVDLSEYRLHGNGVRVLSTAVFNDGCIADLEIRVVDGNAWFQVAFYDKHGSRMGESTASTAIDGLYHLYGHAGEVVRSVEVVTVDEL